MGNEDAPKEEVRKEEDDTPRHPFTGEPLIRHDATIKMVRAILIDPFACQVTDVEVDANDIHIYRLLSHQTVKVVDFFESASNIGLAEGDALYNGLIRDPPVQRFFVIDGNLQPLAGKGLIMGFDEGGSITDAKSKLSTIKVVFAKREDDKLVQTSEPWEVEDNQ